MSDVTRELNRRIEARELRHNHERAVRALQEIVRLGPEQLVGKAVEYARRALWDIGREPEA